MTFMKPSGVPSMRMYPYTSPVRTGQLAPHEQIDIGEYIGASTAEDIPAVRVYVDYEFVSPTGGAMVLFEPVSIRTAEHWVFLSDHPYDPARPFGVKRVGPATSLVHASLTDFLREMATTNVDRYVIARAVTLPPPSPGAPPMVPSGSSAILGRGAYRVVQNEQEVGALLATEEAEHWGVARSYDIEIGFDLSPFEGEWDYARWAAYVNAHFDPCIYWLVTGEAGTLPRQ